MELAEKVLETLSRSIPVEYARLEEDDGITGFVVSPRFLGMTSLDRQGLIESTLTASPDLISPQEYRQVLMIAAVTPDEYDSVGARIRVHEDNEQADGGVEILLYGKPNDAEYVRGVVNKIQSVDATSPKQEPRAESQILDDVLRQVHGRYPALEDGSRSRPGSGPLHPDCQRAMRRRKAQINHGRGCGHSRGR